MKKKHQSALFGFSLLFAALSMLFSISAKASDHPGATTHSGNFTSCHCDDPAKTCTCSGY